ncbi:type II secretion system protein [Sulfuricurvum sp.]|uniref:type II secretion system protein n=1 Tax=Sulfuricurvum sp. TaxID=2025608 RepID=UPI002626215B|nr:type II secretion system protein [Sulfuricurvum sp.]MDD2265961.1 type II secretion system protein [Sulfuricurvum sp.]MDD2783481.1 type II secretion system protein [Sulfuricurvum sp.]
MKALVRTGFTLVELIFVIVIIGVLSAVAIPKFANLTDNSKIAAELATASSVQSALDAIHSEWISNTCDFDWGNGKNTATTPLNASGYPDSLGSDSAHPFDYILKNTDNGDWILVGGKYYGPATKDGTSTKNRNIAHKPEGNDYWEYNATAGTFTLIDVN